jgi:hypothetical protein
VKGAKKRKKSPEVRKMLKAMIAGACAVAMLTGTAAMANHNTDTQTLGGYTKEEITEISEEMIEIFDEATDMLIGVDYEAVEFIGRQIVNGTNYQFKAEKQVVYPGAEKEEVIITVHQALDGTVSVLSIE